MIEKAREVVEAMKEAFDIFSKMELPIDERNCLLEHEAVTAIINGFQQLERERDVLIADLKSADQNCDFCLHKSDHDEPCIAADFDCNHCDANCHCKTCKDNRNWQWRGVQEAENENTNENACAD